MTGRNGELVCRVTAAAEDGKANAAVRKLLAAYWHIPMAAISIVRGQTSRRKTISRP